MKSASARVPPSPPAETPRLARAPGIVGRVLLLSILQQTSYNNGNADTQAATKASVLTWQAAARIIRSDTPICALFRPHSNVSIPPHVKMALDQKNFTFNSISIWYFWQSIWNTKKMKKWNPFWILKYGWQLDWVEIVFKVFLISQFVETSCTSARSTVGCGVRQTQGGRSVRRRENQNNTYL